ncbi:hypothetical protein [Oscillatoria salina]|uniref:hypothetical protein n=1 Tax=Oscillatoria salina TaxID=331517 RepID=UPI0013B8A3BB|nr:hypothetical protein [Oscillatoria salina]MBZ8183321.1 hypothetical protein [Oscillatoria salina IIICB1]NET90279.1 hypothetical protein [Kamptonema sp. SIO1D9]
MSKQGFVDFIQKVTKAEDKKASKHPLTGTIGNFDRSLSGEAKVNAVAKQLATAAKSEGFDVSEADVKAYMEDLKNKYESDPMTAAMMDSFCNSTCHIGTAVGS